MPWTGSWEALIGKSLLIIAAVVVVAAYAWLMVWIGKTAGRAAEAARRTGVSPKWAREVTAHLRALLAPPAADAAATEFVVLPEALRKRTQQLLQDAPGQAEDRRARRAAGWL